MKAITRKPEIKDALGRCFAVYHSDGLTGFVSSLNNELLVAKIRFPLLEYCGLECFKEIKEQDHLNLCEQIFELKTIGGNVLIGIILQKRLQLNFQESMEKVASFTSRAHIWYICDIIGERTFGFSLLHEPAKTLPVFEDCLEKGNRWVVRSLGAGSHYAIKKGLTATYVDLVFSMLLSKASTKDKEERQGMGWAAKTTAKFHPDIIERRIKEVENEGMVANWFRRKIKMGLERNAYAKRNSG